MLHATRILHAKLTSLTITSAHPPLESFCCTRTLLLHEDRHPTNEYPSKDTEDV